MSDRTLSAHALVELLQGLPDDAPLYRALADRLRLLSIDGRIPPDTRLPSERHLAQALDVSRTTVSQAYAALRASSSSCCTPCRTSPTSRRRDAPSCAPRATT